MFCVQLSFVSFAIATLGSNSREYFAKLENPSVELLERLPNVRPSQFHLISDLEKFHLISDLEKFDLRSDLEKFEISQFQLPGTVLSLFSDTLASPVFKLKLSK